MLSAVTGIPSILNAPDTPLAELQHEVVVLLAVHLVRAGHHGFAATALRRTMSNLNNLEMRLENRRFRQLRRAAQTELRQWAITRRHWGALLITTSEIGGYGFGTGLQMHRSRGRLTAAARKLGPHHLEQNAEKWALARIAKAADTALGSSSDLERQRLAQAASTSPRRTLGVQQW